MKFGPKQTLPATLSENVAKAAHSGVYIAGQDYLCISLNPEGAKEATGAGAKAGEDKSASSGSFILILRRQR